MSAHELGQAPSDGEDDGLPRRKLKGGRGYVKPRPGTAENDMLKRAARKDATGLVHQDKIVGKPKPDLVRGRPLQEWLTPPGKQDDIIFTSDGRARPVTRIATTAGTTSNGIGQSSGLPPVAILAGSRGGRLVASGITIAGDHGGGGFNIKVAKAIAKEAARVAAAEEALRAGEGTLGGRERDGTRGREGTEVAARLGSARFGKLAVNSQRATTAATAPRHMLGRGGSPVKPSSSEQRREGDNGHDKTCDASLTSGDGGGSSVGSGGHGGGSGPMCRGIESAAAKVVGKNIPRTRGLTSDSVIWAASSRRRSRSTPSARGKRWNGSGQGETIRRLVHMGLL